MQSRYLCNRGIYAIEVSMQSRYLCNRVDLCKCKCFYSDTKIQHLFFFQIQNLFFICE